MDALDMLMEAQAHGLYDKPALPPKKGQCPHCLKRIGTGIHRHRLACKERKK